MLATGQLASRLVSWALINHHVRGAYELATHIAHVPKKPKKTGLSSILGQDPLAPFFYLRFFSGGYGDASAPRGGVTPESPAFAIEIYVHGRQRIACGPPSP